MGNKGKSGWFAACSGRTPAWIGLLPVALVFVVVAGWTWRKRPDVLVDFGMQLYVPWRICKGDVLYHDVMYLPGGPLSQYFNALLFKIFGTSLQTLVWVNLSLAAGLVAFIYHRFLAVTDRLTATLIALGIVLVFVFGHYELIGNYNYVTPYCHEVFHGLILAIVTVAMLADWVGKRKIRFAAAAGLGVGLVVLTKPEIFLALAICTTVAVLIVIFEHQQRSFAIKSLAAFLLAGSVPLLGFLAIFLRHEDWSASLRAVFFAWVPLGHTSIQQNRYYQWCLGLDMPTVHLKAMLVQFVIVVLAVAIGAWWFRSKAGRPSPWPMACKLGLFSLALVALIGMTGSKWVACGSVLPMLTFSACILLGWRWRETGLESKLVFPVLWTVFALGLLAKLGFFARIWHYGFALAMPAFVAAIYLLIWLLPAWLEQKFRVDSKMFRPTFSVALVAVFIRLFLCSEAWYAQKTVAIGEGDDRFMTFPPAVNPFHDSVQSAVAWIQTNTPKNATLAVLPEGAMVNYLTRRMNPTHYLVWLPPEMEMFGQTNMVADFEKHPPDYVLMISRSTVEYGMGPFGYYRQYGTELKHWMLDHYDEVYPNTYEAGKFPGHQPFAPLQILKRHTAERSPGIE